MANKNGKNGIFDTQWFVSRGYTFDEKSGSWNPPKFKNPFTEPKRELIFSEDQKKHIPNLISAGLITPYEALSAIIPKQKVNDSPAFEVKPVTEWFIKGNVPSKKNSRINFVRNGRQLSLPSKKHSEYLKSTASQYEAYGIEFRRSVETLGLKYPLYIEFTFVRSSRHEFDYCNACQTCEDIMKDDYKKGVLIKKGWLTDDSVTYLLPSFKPFKYDKENAGVHIKLLIK